MSSRAFPALRQRARNNGVRPQCCGRDGTSRALRSSNQAWTPRPHSECGPRPAAWAVLGVVAVGCIVVAGWIVGWAGRWPVSAHGAGAVASRLGLCQAGSAGCSSPAGEVIYAASPADTHPRRLAVGTSPLLGPDGNWVAYLGGQLDHPTDVRLISTLGGAPRVAGISGQPLVWSPDSRLLAVQGPDGLAIVDARSLRTTAIRLPAGFEGFSFSAGWHDACFSALHRRRQRHLHGRSHRRRDPPADRRSSQRISAVGAGRDRVRALRNGSLHELPRRCLGDGRAAATPTSSPTPALASIPRRGRPTDGVVGRLSRHPQRPALRRRCRLGSCEAADTVRRRPLRPGPFTRRSNRAGGDRMRRDPITVRTRRNRSVRGRPPDGHRPRPLPRQLEFLSTRR